MAEIHLPLSITYETNGVTPIADVIASLKATEDLVTDAISLFPSLIDGLRIEESSLNVRTLSQESPLREILILSIFVTFQQELEEEVPALIEDIFNISVSDRYDTLLTVAFLVVAFYGASLAVDTVKKTFSDSLPRSKFEDLIGVLSEETGKPKSELREIIDARFAKPAALKRVVSSAKRVFLPSQRERNVPVVFDRDRISTETIREIPYVGEAEEKADFDRYKPMYDVQLELHAQDRDRSATGWAAVASEVTSRRLKVKVLDPVEPAEMWGEDTVRANIVVVSKLTSDGYQPAELHITELLDKKDQPEG